MKAATITAPGRVVLGQSDLPAPGAGELRVRVRGCGICGSNLPVWTGRPWFSYPLPPGSPGHEPWGEIDAAGPETIGWEPGARVACLSDRAFAEFVVVDASKVVRLPRALDDAPAPLEPLACAVNVIRRARLARGERVAVVGVGFLGALLIALARREGAAVSAWSRRPFALQIASAAGADDVYALDDDVRARRETFACVIEAAGEQRTLDVASTLVGERGRLVIAGYHQDGPRQIDLQSWNWRGIDVVNAHERSEAVYVDGMRRAADLVASGALDPRPLYTHIFPFDDISRAFDTAAHRPDGFMKALVTT